MASFAKDFVTLLQYLLPGFVAAWVFHSFTSFPKPSQFERVVQALIFTVFVQALVYVVKEALFFVGEKWPLFAWGVNSNLLWSMISAILLGIVFSYFANNDKVHKQLRKWGITSNSRRPWLGCEFWEISQQEDGRRRREWSRGHFVEGRLLS